MVIHSGLAGPQPAKICLAVLYVWNVHYADRLKKKKKSWQRFLS